MEAEFTRFRSSLNVFRTTWGAGGANIAIHVESAKREFSGKPTFSAKCCFPASARRSGVPRIRPPGSPRIPGALNRCRNVYSPAAVPGQLEAS